MEQRAEESHLNISDELTEDQWEPSGQVPPKEDEELKGAISHKSWIDATDE